MSKRKFLRYFPFVAIIVFAFFLTACSGPSVQTPAATATVAVTATPTSLPPEILWVNGQATASAPAQLSTEDTAVEKVINDFAAANSLQVRQISALTGSTDLQPATKIVVLSKIPDNLSTVAGAAPAVQFIELGSSNSSSLANVSSVIARPEDEAFMAGYLTMIIAQDWRAGALLTSDGPLGSAYAQDFENGSRFVCGKCNAFYAPLVSFPDILSESTNSPASTWSNDAATLSQDWLSAVFLDPAAANKDVISAINTYTINADAVYLVSTVSAPQDGSIPWAALLDADYSAGLKNLLPQVLSGKGNLTARAQIILTNVNAAIVSPARQGLFNQTAADLAADQIIPSTVQ